jgi:hypothetical protein
MGWYDALSRSRIPFDLIDDVAVTDGSLQKYELIILPNVSVMSREQARFIEQFVKEGGKIISSFDTSFYDENGEKREKPLLSAILGIEKVEGIATSKYDHIQMDKEKGLSKGIEQTLIPAALLGAKIVPVSNAVPDLFYREPQKSRYCELPEKTSNPYIIHNSYGEGKSIYFTANVGKFYESFALPEYRLLMNNAVRELVEIPVSIKTIVHNEAIHLSMRKKGEKQIILHLVNYTGSMTRPISEVIHLKNVQIEIEINQSISSIKALRMDRDLDYYKKEKNVYIQLDQLKEYEVIVIDMA